MAIQATNEIRMKILQDGTVSIDTDSFEEEVHESAEQLIKETCEALGGERQVIDHKRDHEHHHHTHIHGGQHQHH